MGKYNEDFKMPPVSTLIGSTLPGFIRVLLLGKPKLRFYPKILLSLIIVLISTPFQIFEYFYYRKKVQLFRFKKSPVFIIGHWRSGTTHLHNLLCQDPNHGYVTTYQGVFPNNLMSKWIFKTFMQWKIPETRPADNVKLSPDYPQEEEFALANMTLASFYHFFFFPSKNDTLYDKYIRFNKISEKELGIYKKQYKKLLSKAAINSKRERIIVKNPANTGKIKQLLEMYPNAKFIHIYRNPIITYLSTCKFYSALIPSTALEKFTKIFINEKIIQNYKNLLQDYFTTKKLIPPDNLFEIRFEDFDKHNISYMREIYKQFKLDSWEEAEPYFKNYIAKQKHYKKNIYKIRKSDLEKILVEWDFAMQAFGYKIPDNLKIIEDQPQLFSHQLP